MVLNYLLLVSDRKILLPGLDISELKAINKLFLPSYLLVPMFFCCLIAQVSDNLKGVLNIKEIQQLYSVRVYTKILCSGNSSVTISYLHSIIKTLGYELETLSVLPVRQRLKFLSSLLETLLENKGISRINTNFRLLSNPTNLIQHRRGLALQLRSLFASVPLFSSHSITVGLTVSEINLSSILNSCKDIWFNLSLENEEFDFLLRKEALAKINLSNYNNSFFFTSKSQIDYLKVLLYFELKSFFDFPDIIDFSNDNVILKNHLNLTSLELELGFIQRNLPEFPEEFVISSSDYQDTIIRTSLQQRKSFNPLRKR